MTSDQSALLAAILADPADDTARLVYADWLDENGHPERAYHIRDSVNREDKRETVHAPGYSAAFVVLNGGGRIFDVLIADGIPGISFHTSRGFVSRITCTSADWLRHHESLYWRPGQTMPCPECAKEERPGWRWRKWSGCEACGGSLGVIGSGRVPRPMPPGAQPIERVVLTTEPGSDWPPLKITPDRDGFTCDRWPGIVFEARPAAQDESLNFGDPLMTRR